MASIDYKIGEPRAKWLFGTAFLSAGGGSVILSSLSTDYVQCPVTASEAGTAINPTTLVVALAFTTVGTPPVSGDWKTGSWDTAPSGGYLAQLLVGPGAGGNVYAKGTYAAWVRITDNPEIPVQQVGTLQIV